MNVKQNQDNKQLPASDIESGEVRDQHWHPTNWDPDKWHPVRLPKTSTSRPGKEAIAKSLTSSETSNMQLWIEKNCSGRWRQEFKTDGGFTFWFENADDAMSFAIRWFPIKGL